MGFNSGFKGLIRTEFFPCDVTYIKNMRISYHTYSLFYSFLFLYRASNLRRLKFPRVSPSVRTVSVTSIVSIQKLGSESCAWRDGVLEYDTSAGGSVST